MSRDREMRYEEKSYDVVITIKLKTRINFALMGRDGPITMFDAIDNAVGHMPTEDWNNIADGWGGEFITEFNFNVEEML